MSDERVIVVGAGLAGLCCAIRLAQAGREVLVIERSDRVGGRVTSDDFEGFVLDRGFQVLLDSYPEAGRVLDMPALGLSRFYPGAIVRTDRGFRRVADPWRRPLDAARSVFNPVLPLRDAPRVAAMRGGVEPREGETTGALLAREGLSPEAIERFFRPFFSGVFLERDLQTPAAMFAFVFEMFSRGSATLPEGGMRRIPEQLASRLPEGAIRLSATAEAVSRSGVRLRSGEELPCVGVVDATPDGLAGADHGDRAGWRGATTLWYAADVSPVGEAVLVLAADESEPVNHLCVHSDVSPSYAPPGAALISATVLGVPGEDDAELDAAVRSQLSGWYGDVARRWRLLRADRVARALPERFVRGGGLELGVRAGNGVYRCGDRLENPSIEGAMVSGRLAAEAVLEDLAGSAG